MKKLVYTLILITMFSLFSCSTTAQSVDYSQQENSSTEGKYLYEMGVSYLSAGNNAMAIYYLEKAIQTYKTPDVYNSLALAYQFAGEYVKAENTFKEALEKYPNSPELWTNYGILLAIQKKYNEALSYLEKAANHPTYSRKEIAYYNIALIQLSLGRENLFLENMKKAIMYNSNYLDPYVSLGDYYYDKYLSNKRVSDLQISREYYSKALSLSFNNPVLYFKLGKVYRDLGQIDLAKFYFEKALKASSEDKQLQEEVKKALLDIIENSTKYENPQQFQNQKQTESDLIKDVIK
ncbi:MAG: tetratricopeptide repeat protein [Sulfurihydrogenibium sp.]|uniref:tetratricopeptide repeat protein n=1 Tax=Sulfurihydrogenibium sp. TaxID=2053621 RepID=UPI003C7D930E